MAFSNRYKGNCKTCGIFVPAGEGFYNYGTLTCTEAITISTPYATDICLPAYNRKFNTDFNTTQEVETALRQQEEAQIAETRKRVLEHCINGEIQALAVQANVRSLQQVIIKVTGVDVAISDMDFTQATDVRNELQKRIDRKENAKILETYKASNTCKRCGGAGRSDKWINTGSICYDCGGTGKFYNLK